MWILFDVLLLIAGYVTSIYSWPKVKVWINGVSTKATSLRQKAARLEAKLRSL